MTTSAPAGGLPAPRAARLHRPGWRDPRLLLGLALVGLSVLLGSWAVGTAGRTVPVLVTRTALAPGAVLDATVVETRDVRLGTAQDLYLTPEDLDGSLVVLRTVGRGELVPRAAAVEQGDLALRPVAVVPRTALPTGVGPGSVVDLWSVPAPPSGGQDRQAPAPTLLAEQLVVAEVTDADAAFSVGGAATVHVLVPAEVLPTVLAAVTGGGSIEVLPVGGTAP